MDYCFTATIIQNSDMDAAYVIVPIDIKDEYGKGRLKVEATFDSVSYNGSVVNMGVKDSDGNVCYIIGIPKAIRSRIGKTFGDRLNVGIRPVLWQKFCVIQPVAFDNGPLG